jgi:hypothetical protein
MEAKKEAKKREEQQAKAIAQFLSKPANQKCCDCSSRSKI